MALRSLCGVSAVSLRCSAVSLRRRHGGDPILAARAAAGRDQQNCESRARLWVPETCGCQKPRALPLTWCFTAESVGASSADGGEADLPDVREGAELDGAPRPVGAENRVTAFHQRLRRAIGLVVMVHGRSCMVAHCGVLTRLPHTRPRAEPAGTARSIRFSERTSRSCCCVTNWPCCGENTLACLKDAKAGAAARTSREAAQPRPAQSHTHPSHDQPSPYDRSPNDATRSAVVRRPPDMREVQVPTAPPARADARA
jgi:hypothetical protein